MAIIAGVDEAGRGPLAGPVVASAVVLPEDHPIEGLRDSKKLTPKKREILFGKIYEFATAIGVGVVDEKEIDRTNILKATHKAMQMALGRLGVRPEKALVDGYALPNQVIPNEGIIGGDDKVDSIRAASIIAKVTRDRMMEHYDIIFPEYGFAKHKGYGTKTHIESLNEWKASPIHRRTFRPVMDYMPTLGWYRKHRRVGMLGEQLAALFLFNNGHVIRAMNVRCQPYGEIDIISEENDTLIFTEVKTISKKSLGTPEEKIDELKLSKLENAIEMYMVENEVKSDVRLDAITVTLGKGKPIIKHYKGVELD